MQFVPVIFDKCDRICHIAMVHWPQYNKKEASDERCYYYRLFSKEPG